MLVRAARLRSTAGTTLVVAALTCTMGLATQLPAAAAAGCAHPGIEVLDTLGGSGGRVMALGRGTIAAGSSAGVPAYWIGSTVIKVPLAARYSGYGTVNAINRHDLMVGTVYDDTTRANVAFSYRIGAARARILPGGSYADDVNDSGRIVGGGPFPADHLYVWHGTEVERELTVAPGFSFPRVSGINNAGTVIGAASDYQPGFPSSAGVGLVWPSGTTGPAVPLLPIDSSDDSGISYDPEDIDENGRIVGEKTSFWADGSYETYWDAPYTADATEVPGLPGYYNEGYFRAISPTTGLVAGEAPTSYYGDLPAGTAEIWTGSGPIRALPAPDADADSGASAVADNGDVGGYAVLASGEGVPVIWTCAAQQAL